MLSEEVLIKECIKDSRLAQKELYDRFAPAMRAICLRYAKDPDDAKDILQEGFIKIFSKIHQYSKNGSLQGWIKRIIINTAIDHFNRSKHSLKVDISDYEQENTESLDIHGAEIDKRDFREAFGYDLLLQAEISQQEILAAIQKLPDHFRVCFNLYFIENYSHKEIGQLLKIDETTSRTRINRAKKSLQTMLYDLTIQKLSK